MVKTIEQELMQLYKNASSKAEKNYAFEKLLDCNGKMLASLVKKTWHKPERVSSKELRHFASIGLFRALESYDAKKAKGASFSTYAYRVIKNYLNEEVRNSDLVPISAYFRKQGYKCSEMSEYNDDFHSTSSYSERSDYLSGPEMACFLNAQYNSR